MITFNSFSQAQEPFEKYWAVDVQGGIGITLGNFANKSVANNKSGYAENGLGLTINCNYFFKKDWAISGGWQYAYHNFDVAPFTNQYSGNFSDTQSSSSNSGWTSRSFLAGVVKTQSITDKLKLYASVKGGGAIVLLPQYRIEIPDLRREFTQQEAITVGFVFSSSLGIEYDLNQNLSIQLLYNQFGGLAHFRNVKIYERDGAQNTIRTGEWRQEILIGHVFTGVAYHF